MFDHVAVINMNRRPDRWERFQREFPADWPWAPPQRLDAIDGRGCTPPDWFKGPVGAWGCMQSHIALWYEQFDRGWDSVLVFEDDAVFCRDAVQQMQDTLACVPDDWDQIYFGGQHLHTAKDEMPPEAIIRDRLIRCRYVNRTHAYAIRLPFAEAAIEAIDCPMSTSDGRLHHVDYQLGEMHASGQWNIYAPWRFCIGQAAGESDVRNMTRQGRAPHTKEQWWTQFPIADKPVAELAGVA